MKLYFRIIIFLSAIAVSASNQSYAQTIVESTFQTEYTYEQCTKGNCHCGQEYKVQKNDNLSYLSKLGTHYKKAKFWPIIYRYNKDRIGDNPALIYPGTLLRIPCLDDNGNPLPGQFPEVTGEQNIAVKTQGVESGNSSNQNEQPTTMPTLNLLTGDDFGLFADKNVSNGRMVEKIVETAISNNNSIDKVGRLSSAALSS